MNHLVIKGVGVSSGIAQGKAYVLTLTADVAIPRRSLEEDQIEGELARLEAALTRAESELLTLAREVAANVGDDAADVFAAQALVARDHLLYDQVFVIVSQHRVNAEAAVADVIEKLTRTFDQIADPYMRERAADIRDVGRRVLAALALDEGPSVPEIPEGSILVVDELLPSSTAVLDLTRTRAFVSDRGGKFSHTSILARSMRMPAVVGVAEATLKIKSGDHLIVDGLSGVVFVNPNQSVLREYDRLEAELRGYKAELGKMVDLPAVTRDGTEVTLLANASKLSDTEAAMLYKADGVGLYRTEFGFAVRTTFPTEDEQYAILKLAAERIHPRKMVFRLLDIGGDKELPYLPLPASRNPSLDQRGIRLLLKHPDVLRRQLRAMLRVSAHHPVSILLPVVGGLDEVRATRAILNAVMQELTDEGTPFNPNIPMGAMIEIPAAAIVAAALAREVDFFSLGTNDLVQYVLAADRESDAVADYYRPLHPAVLNLIGSVCRAASEARLPVTICGEIAGDPIYTALLLGLGLRAFSVAPGEMLEVKNAIRKVTIADAQALALEALDMGAVSDVEALLQRQAASVAPQDQ